MLTRIVAAFLWLLAGWNGGAIIAEVLGISVILGPILGLTAAFLVAVDPLHAVWHRPTDPASRPSPHVPKPA